MEKERIVGEQMGNYKTQIKDLKEQLASQWALLLYVNHRKRIQQAKSIADSEQAQRVHDLETKLQEQLSLLAGGDSQGLAAAVAQQRETQLLLEKTSRELHAAQSEAERYRQHVEEGKAVAITLQEELKQTKESNDKLITELKSQVTALQVEKTALARQATEHEAEVKNYQTKEIEQNAVLQEVERQLEQSKNQIYSLQKDIDSERANSRHLRSDLRESDAKCQSLKRENQEKEVALETVRASQKAAEVARVKAEQETCDCQKQLSVVMVD